VALTDDTAIGISRSVLLTFSFPDSNTKPIASPTSGIDSGSVTSQRELMSMIKVEVHAIPVLDGDLIKDEEDLAQIFESTDEFQSSSGVNGVECGLLNEFDIPWVERSGIKYPIYKKTITLKETSKFEETKDDGSQEGGEDEEDHEEDDDYGEADEPSAEESNSEKSKSEQDDSEEHSQEEEK
jgi:hypothetical protein